MKTILILDDEWVVRESFVGYFEDRMWRPIQAESAEEALELLEVERPDAAIVDVRLPGMNGNNFIREAVVRMPGMAFVICTGSPEYIVPDDFLGMPGVSNFLFKKPVTHLVDLEVEILQVIERLERKDAT